MAKKKSASSRKKARKAVSKKRISKKKAVKAAKKKPAKKAAAKAAVKVPVGKFNMLVTYDPNHRGIAEMELKEVMKQVGAVPRIAPTEVDGLFKVAVKDSRKTAVSIATLVMKNPAVFMSTHHYTPVDTWVKSEVPAMQQAVKKAADSIGNSERWKMGLNKRHWNKMDSVPLIIKLTDVISKQKVDLNNPQKIVQVEIIGKEAGVALLKPNELVDVPRIKANM
ncbi:hypothetical protein JXB11_02310 [Candidatus Woesearchaeota archaeon]|nr:hypothetical protein [Candidatus Woesearchaeota archaeon]